MLLLRNLAGCVLSAFLLIFSYPQIECWQVAWVALVPWLFVLSGKSYRSAFGCAFLFGFLFFFGVIGWLIFVTWPGAVLLSSYLALYIGFFALGFVYFQKLAVIPRVFVLSSLWAVLEFFRSILFTGFGWGTLGHSQYKNIFLIQIADITGVYGISFLVILVNLVVFETFRAVICKKTQVFAELRRLQGIVLIILVLCFAYGIWVFKTIQFPSTIKVSVIQPNIPQNIKWNETYMPSIVKQTLDLTDKVTNQHPDIILWPETSLPGILSEQPAYLEQIQLKAMDLKTPIVMGAIIQEKDHYYNSAVYIGSNGTMQGSYKKIHLVPFGEFLPFRPILGWLNRYIGLDDFTSGREYTLFPVGNTSHKFGVLICFEDTLSDLWRDFTKAGAEVFMNMTNDAWFMDTKAPFMHLQSAVIECVANKRSLVRSANTGVSGFIDPLGRIISLAQDSQKKKTFVAVVASAQVPLNNQMTFYTKYADIFTYLCFVCILWGIWILRVPVQKTGRKDA